MSESERAEARAPLDENGQCWQKMITKIETVIAPRRAVRSWREVTGSVPRAEDRKAEKRPRRGMSVM